MKIKLEWDNHYTWFISRRGDLEVDVPDELVSWYKKAIGDLRSAEDAIEDHLKETKQKWKRWEE